MRLDCPWKFFRSFPLLRELHLYGCELNDFSIEPLQHLNQLECLILCDNFCLTGTFIGALVQLKVLNLYGCSGIQHSNFKQICRAMRNLKSLDIRRCDQLTAIFLNSLAEHCKQLEILKISCQAIPLKRVSFPPRLKHIELLLYTNFSVPHTKIFLELAENNSKQLETLKIYGKNSINNQQISLISKLEKLKLFYCPNNQAIDDDALREFCKLKHLEELVIRKCGGVTNGALLKLLRNCKHLRRINIEFCKQITNEFVLEAINVLKDRKDRSQTPLVLFVFGTSIDESGLSEYQKYKAAEKGSLNKVVCKALTDEKALDVNEIYELWDSDDWFDVL